MSNIGEIDKNLAVSGTIHMSLCFLDYDHNAPSIEHLAETHEPFFLTVRETHPDLPIIMASWTDTPKTP